MKLITGVCVLCILVPGIGRAQPSMGTIAGVVHDSSGAVIVGGRVQAISLTTDQGRTTVTAQQGEYSFPALLAGAYEVSVETPGFARTVRAATVDAGTTTTADFTLLVGDVSQSVTVAAASPQIHRDSVSVSGLITREQIAGLPLNGRSFLELAKLEPGVQSPTVANRNRTLLPGLGAPALNVGGTRFMVDGGSVTAVGLGGAQMNLSQEVVQEFQVSTVNDDLSAGLAATGAVNVVTRPGGNQRQGTAFYFFRDHNLAAYPALNRDPAHEDPFFQRQQFGVAVGGPVKRDRVFYFGSWERNDQRAVAATTLLAPDFAHLSRVTTSPSLGDLLSVRVDATISDALTAFVRYSHDGNRVFGPPATGTGPPNTYPSNWIHTSTWADQSLIGLTAILRPTLVNDLRVSYFFLDASMDAAGNRDCPGCLGLGAPSISIPQAGLVIGASNAVNNFERRFHVTDSITWQVNRHRARFGVDWQHSRDRNLIWNNNPVTMTLFSPDRVRSYNALPGTSPEQRIPLPTDFHTLDDILQLPLQSITVGIGNPGVPQEDGGTVRGWNTLWLYGQDTWQLHERLTLTYGLGWGIDGVLNHDLAKPALLAPIFGAAGLGPTRNNWTNFSPTLGVVWAASSAGTTVVRAGIGRFYGVQGVIGSMDAERVALGPAGLGRQNFSGTSIFNSLPGIPGVAVGTPLDFRVSPTLFTGAHLMTILPALRAALSERLANADSTVQGIQISKQQASPAIFPADVPDPSTVQAHLGLQRELGRGVVISADVVYRHFMHVPLGGGALDANHFRSIRGPIIPVCVGDQGNNPQAVCSLGPINVQEAPYRATDRSLVLRAEKRFPGQIQVLGSYQYSRNTATSNGSGFNLDDWLQNTGPTGFTHVLNLAGVMRLPLQLELGFNFSYSSAPPFSAYVGGFDFNGDGTTDDLLPGTTVNAFNRGMGRADLERLVARFNDVYAGTRDAQGTSIPRLTLPAEYSFGDNVHSLDARLSRSFVTRPHWRVSLIGEVFNLYNAANLSGYSGDLTAAGFGQPTSRATQVFGSGGPRAFQLAARVSF